MALPVSGVGTTLTALSRGLPSSRIMPAIRPSKSMSHGSFPSARPFRAGRAGRPVRHGLRPTRLPPRSRQGASATAQDSGRGPGGEEASLGAHAPFALSHHLSADDELPAGG